MWRPSILILTVLLAQAYTAPQFITFKEGKLGVNFGGYHAAVGLGGLLGGNGGAGGGLFAEAGTPQGQAARAGLGGSVGSSGPQGGLYAGATAGGNVKAEAGLGGEVGAGGSAGAGFASASNGYGYSSSSMGGKTVVQETVVVPVEEVRPVHKKVHSEVKTVAVNEIIPLAKANVDVKAEVQPTVTVKEVSNRRVPRHHRSKYYKAKNVRHVLSSWFSPQIRFSQPTWYVPRQYYVKQVYVEPPPTKVIEKTIIKTRKPHRHHLRKTAYIGGYIGAGADTPISQPAVIKTVQPISRRSDVEVEGEAHANAGAGVNVNAGGAGDITYTKRVTVQKNPTFFQDIFNIPIATLQAVNSFLTNTAGNTAVSVEKHASVQADSDLESSKHVPASKSVASSSEAHISVKTPSATTFLDDIFAIPINTLSAVNSFLENNVGRRKVEYIEESSNEPTKVRLGPHARRRANKQVIIVEEPSKPELAPQ